MGKLPGPRPPLQGQAGVPESWPRRYTNTETLRSRERNMPHAPLTPTHTQSKGTHAGPRPSPQAVIEGTDLLLAGPSGVCSPPMSAAHAQGGRAGISERNACGCVYAHTCAELSAPSAADSLVYSNSTLGPRLPPCWPPKPACLFQPLWPPVRELGGGAPAPLLAEGEYIQVCERERKGGERRERKMETGGDGERKRERETERDRESEREREGEGDRAVQPLVQGSNPGILGHGLRLAHSPCACARTHTEVRLHEHSLTQTPMYTHIHTCTRTCMSDTAPASFTSVSCLALSTAPGK